MWEPKDVIGQIEGIELISAETANVEVTETVMIDVQVVERADM